MAKCHPPALGPATGLGAGELFEDQAAPGASAIKIVKGSQRTKHENCRFDCSYPARTGFPGLRPERLSALSAHDDAHGSCGTVSGSSVRLALSAVHLLFTDPERSAAAHQLLCSARIGAAWPHPRQHPVLPRLDGPGRGFAGHHYCPAVVLRGGLTPKIFLRALCDEGGGLKRHAALSQLSGGYGRSRGRGGGCTGSVCP